MNPIDTSTCPLLARLLLVVLTWLSGSLLAQETFSQETFNQETPAQENHAVILLYHHIAHDTPAATSTTPEQFAAHMQYLADNEFTVWRLDKLLQHLRNAEPVPDKTVAITFDDGYLSIFDTAYPLLQALGFPFTVFINTQPINASQTGYMSWAQVQQMTENGVMIANHMVNHPHMIDAMEGESASMHLQRMRAEMLQAEAEIAAQTGQSHRILAYPYGEYDPDIKQMLAAAGFIGIAQNSGAISANSDFLALPRFPLAGIYADMAGMRTKSATLAFHVLDQQPESPLTDSRNPAVILQFAPGNFNPDQLACYAGGATLEIEWLDRDGLKFRIQPQQQFNSRRWGYNCTAPARNSNRFYWYSKFWTRSTPENRD
ncbi:MAG: polysaccharide deacetylase family protein [Pseudomonadales bacterium]|nr:polysaccharide deacetylase family protein [Pseudomonadales bacterium]